MLDVSRFCGRYCFADHDTIEDGVRSFAIIFCRERRSKHFKEIVKERHCCPMFHPDLETVLDMEAIIDKGKDGAEAAKMFLREYGIGERE